VWVDVETGHPTFDSRDPLLDLRPMPSSLCTGSARSKRGPLCAHSSRAGGAGRQARWFISSRGKGRARPAAVLRGLVKTLLQRPEFCELGAAGGGVGSGRWEGGYRVRVRSGRRLARGRSCTYFLRGPSTPPRLRLDALRSDATPIPKPSRPGPYVTPTLPGGSRHAQSHHCSARPFVSASLRAASRAGGMRRQHPHRLPTVDLNLIASPASIS